MCKEKPFYLGRSIDAREDWESCLDQEARHLLLERANALLEGTLPSFTDEDYLVFSETGSRKGWQDSVFAMRANLKWIVLAECIENRGRFLPLYERYANTLCSLKTWVLPAHDKQLDNFHGNRIDIDLISSSLAAHLATSCRILEPRLSSETQRQIRSNVVERVLQPFKDMVLNKREQNWWLTKRNNWNAVCLSGVAIASQAIVDSREERAFYLREVSDYSRNYLKGFTADGYCSEGLGYWNYGFGAYVMLAEVAHQATDGELDLMGRPGVKAPARFAQNMEIIHHKYPAFADCPVNSKPDRFLADHVNRRFRLAPARTFAHKEIVQRCDLLESLLYLFPRSLTGNDAAVPGTPACPLRTWFENAGVLICRPASGGPQLAVALKGGHNLEHHNHNDVGSYVVVCNREAVLLDPGNEVYTARTFSAKRYDSDVINSYGHPVPVINGALQQRGHHTDADTSAIILSTEFSEEVDRIAMELKAAYDVDTLESLVRTFTYSRKRSKVTITDKVVFSSPGTYQNAFITLGTTRKLDDHTLLVTSGQESVRIAIQSPGMEFAITSDTLQADTPTRTRPTRIAVTLAQAFESAEITYTISTESSAGGTSKS